MSLWNWNRQAASLVATLLAVSMLSACTDPGSTATQNARADIKVTLSQGIGSADVTRISVVVAGPGIATPITAELARNGSAWEGLINDIPAGPDRLFTATAYDSGSVALYRGQTGPLSILSASTVSIALVLQPVNPPPPFENMAPVIEALVASSNPVQPGGTITLTAQAVDPNGDALSYTWSAPAGAFGSPTSTTTSFTAPSNEGVVRIQLEVTDSKAASTTMSLDLHVLNPGAVGSATVSASFNTWPAISSMTGTPSPLRPGVPTRLFVSVTDADGDALSYSWSSNCPGTYDNPLNPSPSFTLAGPSSTGSCAFQVLLSDGRGAQQRGSLTLPVCNNCESTSVTGVRNVVYVMDETLRHIAPDDLSSLTIGAWVPTANGMGYEYRAGTGLSNGAFFIPNVQRTPYFLQLGTSYTWTTGRSHELRRIVMGRPDAQPLPMGSLLDLQISGLTPWRLDNDLQFHSTGAGLSYFTTIGGCASPSLPAVEGDTFISGSMDYYDSLQFCGNTPNRIDGSRGDVLYVTHHESRLNPGTGTTVQELRQAFQTSTVTETSSGLFNLSGTMGTLPTRLQSVDFRTSAFEAQALAAHPNATLNRHSLNIGTLPGYQEFANYASWPDLVTAIDFTPGQGDSFTTFEYGDPYPSHWTRFLSAGATSTVSYSVPLPDGTTSAPRTLSVLISSREPLQPGMTHVVLPQMGPPQALRLNGMTATTSLSGVGPSPLVSWSPPALGIPNRYSVRVYRFSATSTGGTSRVTLGTFNTTEQQLRLPPNLLVPGNDVYAIQVYAYSELNNGTITHYASALTSGFTR